MKKVRESLYESYDEDPFDDHFNPEEDYDEEYDEDYEDEWSQDNNPEGKEELLEEIDSVEQSIWASHIQAAKDEWEEVTSNALEGKKYWTNVDNWTLETTIESGRDILRKYT